MKARVLVLWVVIGAVCWGQIIPTDEGVDRAALAVWNAGHGKELGKQETAAQIAYNERLLSAAKNARINKNLQSPQIGEVNGRIAVAFPSTKSKADTIDGLKDELSTLKERLKDPPPAYPLMAMGKLAKGKIGVLSFGRNVDNEFYWDVIQVVDADNMIVHLGGTPHKNRVTAWLQVPTKGMTDGMRFKPEKRLYEVVGTKQYQTVDGTTNTIFHLVERTHDELQRGK